MTVGEALWSFAVVAALLTIIPGLDTALVLRASLTQSRVHAYATALGICAGALVWGAAAAVGASAILHASEIAFTILKLVGAAYMLWFGTSLIVGSFRKTYRLPNGEVQPAGSLRRSFGRGALTNILNPKVGVFYMALIPQFIPTGTVPLAMGLSLALVHVVEVLIWFSLIIVATQHVRRFLTSARISRWIDRATGGVLIGFAGVLAWESRP